MFYMHVCAHVHTGILASALVNIGQKPMLAVFCINALPQVLSQSPSMNIELTILATVAT